MTRHLVLGAGNLGWDLATALGLTSQEVHIAGRRTGNMPGFFDFQGSDGVKGVTNGRPGMTIADLVAIEPDVIWCTVGAGGPSRDPNYLSTHLNAHVALPMALATAFEGRATKLIFFSTCYLNKDPRGDYSGYAFSKAALEKLIEPMENARVFRVGSLYGAHNPLSTLPGKMLLACKGLRTLPGELNLITPTPTAWIAKEMVDNRYWEFFGQIDPGQVVSPNGGLAVHEWIQIILDEIKKQTGGTVASIAQNKAYRMDYPIDNISKVNCLYPMWDDLWKEHGPDTIKAAIWAVSLQCPMGEVRHLQPPGLLV